MSEDKLLKARVDGSRARDLLSDELLQGALAELKRAYAEKLLATSVSQSAEREILYQAHRIVGEFENHLRQVLDSGKLADAELNNLITIQERKKRFGLI
jgi:hypothetical protein